MFKVEDLQDQLKTCIDQRAQAEQMFHRLTGAMQVLEQQIQLLETEEQESLEKEDAPEEIKD